MALTKADIARKIADDCGFMKEEATEVFEKILDIIKARLIVYDLKLDGQKWDKFLRLS